MTATSASRIEGRLSEHGARVSAGELSALAAFYDVLYKWNARMNLTALQDGQDAIDRLIVEPVLAAVAMPESGEHLDVGSGGGSPALPVHVMRSGYCSTLVESRAKKAAFLREASRVVGGGLVRVESCRLEALSPREVPFSVVTVRAVRMDGPLMAALQRLVAPGATLWYFTGPNQAFEDPGAGWTRRQTVELLPEKQSRVVCFTWNTA